APNIALEYNLDLDQVPASSGEAHREEQKNGQIPMKDEATEKKEDEKKYNEKKEEEPAEKVLRV
ncbi:hypothetical protein HPP92_026975, partial [Vanilla planifolia]